MEFPSLSIRLLPSGSRFFLVTISCDQALWPQKQLWLARTFDQMNFQRLAYWRPELPSIRSEPWEEALFSRRALKRGGRPQRAGLKEPAHWRFGPPKKEQRKPLNPIESVS